MLCTSLFGRKFVSEWEHFEKVIKFLIVVQVFELCVYDLLILFDAKITSKKASTLPLVDLIC